MQRFYERSPRAYLLFALGIALLITSVLAVLHDVYFGAYLYRLSARHFWILFAFGEGGAVVALAVGFIAQRRTVQLLQRWTSGRPRSQQLAEELAVRLPGTPRRFTFTLFAVAIPFALVPANVTVLAFADRLGGWDFLVTFLSAVLPAGYALIFDWFWLEFCLQRVSADVGRFRSDDAVVRSASGISLPTKMVAGIGAATVASAEFVAAASQRRGSGAHGASNILILTGVSSSIYLLTVAVSVTLIVLIPIRHLIQSTKAVARGDLSQTIPVTTDDDLGYLIANHNAMVLGLRERERLREERLGLVEELRASRERIVAAADAGRRKVERDLHDGAQQRLVLLRLKLGLLAKHAAGDASLMTEIDDVRVDLDKALRDLRNLAHGLYPPQLEEGGLAEALREAATSSAIPTHVEPDGVGRYGAELEAAVYFCCVEALQNAVKHAGDDARVVIRLSEQDGHLEFEVRDDGCGYDVNRTRSPHGGTQNIIDRVGALGGVVAVRSASGGGTTVKASIPLGGR